MNRRQFVQNRKDDWKRFAFLVERLKGGTFSDLSSQEVSEFSNLFRKLCHDLSIIRTRAWGRGLIAYLNHLVGRGHNCFYRSPPGGFTKFRNFLTTGFPRVFRRNFGYFVTAAVLFFLPLAVTWTIVAKDPTLAHRVIDPGQLEMFGSMYGERKNADDEDDEESQFLFPGDERSAMAGFYISNNVGIALRCFSQGILLGIGTVYTLIFNGIVIGTIAGYITSLSDVHREHFLSFVVAHGSFELTGIAVAGGAGLILGHAWISPGQRTRIGNLVHRGQDAVQIAGGAGVMIFIAAFIEAFWSPVQFPLAVKVAAAIPFWLVVIFYLGVAGRETHDAV